MGSLFFILLFLTLMSLSSLPVWKEDRLLLKERESESSLQCGRLLCEHVTL